ncbi:helix-turn-helix domain-containing protein [Chitinophaga sp. CF118]|uniref:winged helix-turn-helix transcriptional regulator n=1 Tax=Chitinophaga sp. CF118 TaxID=1884367 RepID=UPI000B7CD93E|nr:helix-turn-helix domain-containing protein [Chitinophaga sp. CF118]
MLEDYKKFDKNIPCPVRSVMDRIGDKWAVLVITTLGEKGTTRFNQLHEMIGDISQKMLTVTLKKLEEDGLVSRKMYQEIPPRVEYKLTATGDSLLPHLIGLSEWALANMSVIQKSREEYVIAK